MAPSPFRRRKAAKTVRNLAIAEAALALAKDRAGKGSRRPSGKLLAIGGAVAAVGAAALLKRDKVAGLLPSRTGEPEPAPPAPPQPSNYDAPGPVANTATPIPAPDPHGEPPATIDASAEEAAAAAEAAAIGGTVSDYAGSEPGERADEAQIPLAEAGEGESEGHEQAEAELADNATYRDAGMTDAERQIEDSIEQADQPSAGETPEPLSEPGGGISGRPFSGLDEEDEPDGGEAASGTLDRRRHDRRRRPPPQTTASDDQLRRHRRARPAQTTPPQTRPLRRHRRDTTGSDDTAADTTASERGDATPQRSAATTPRPAVPATTSGAPGRGARSTRSLDAFYERDGDAFVPSELTRGPWDPAAQHAGPPSALLAAPSSATAGWWGASRSRCCHRSRCGRSPSSTSSFAQAATSSSSRRS